jgi:hypothetical protein
MNWTSIDASVQRLRSLADVHGLAKVASEHVVVLPRVAHADYMRRCGEQGASVFLSYVTNVVCAVQCLLCICKN